MLPPARRVEMFEDDWQRARELGLSRHEAAKVKDLESGYNPLRTDQEGVYAEIAFARYYGCDMDQVFHVGRDADKVDFWVQGYRVDVKSTPIMGAPHLLVLPKSLEFSDVFFLVSVKPEGRLALLRGWAWRGEVEEYPAVPFVRPNPVHAVPLAHLREVRRRSYG